MAVLAGADPAAAATQVVSGPVIAPVGTFGSIYDEDFQGVLLDGSLGLVQFAYDTSHLGCCSSILLTTTDGSTLSLGAVSQVFTPVLSLPNNSPLFPSAPIVTSHDHRFVVASGTGRFAGASGTATLGALTTAPLAGLIPGSGPRLSGAVMVGNLSVVVTTP